jgi:hypothetical protein
MLHDSKCPKSGKWYVSKECREFSTDGTGMGALIAHTFGTTDEAEIEEIGRQQNLRERQANLTGMTEEQADWESCIEPEELEL